MPPGAWFRPPRHLLVSFLVFALAPVAALGWLGWRLLEQERQVFFTKGGAPGQDLTFGLWRVPAQGGEAQEVGLTMEFLRGLRVHPDGQRIAFAAGWSGAPEVWVMENVPRPTEASK